MEHREVDINILGLLATDKCLNMRFTVVVSRVRATSRVMDWVADKAAEQHPNGSIDRDCAGTMVLYTSQLTRRQWQRWQEQGLSLFFLPKYCSEMNRLILTAST